MAASAKAKLKIEISENAAKKIEDLAVQDERQDCGLRVKVVGGAVRVCPIRWPWTAHVTATVSLSGKVPKLLLTVRALSISAAQSWIFPRR